MKSYLRLFFLLAFLLPVVSNAAPAGTRFDVATALVLQRCSELSLIDIPQGTGFEHPHLTIARKNSITPKARRRLVAVDNENEDEESSIQARKDRCPRSVACGPEGYFSTVFCTAVLQQGQYGKTDLQDAFGNHPPQYISRKRHVILQVFRI